MNFARFLSQESIDLYLTPDWVEYDEDGEEIPVPIRKVKEVVSSKMSELLAASGRIQNQSKLSRDLFNLEKRNSSAIGEGIAIPHMRCLQTRGLIMGFARYTPGIQNFDSPDDQEVQLFIPMIAPPYEDRQYLKVYRGIAKAFLETNVKEMLLEVHNPGEVIRIFNNYFR